MRGWFGKKDEYERIMRVVVAVEAMSKKMGDE